MGVNGIYGLSGSGLDVESMVKTAMKAKQAQYDKMYKKEVKQEWIKSAYNDFYNSLTTYKYTTLSNYKMQSNMNAMKANSTSASTVTATANGEAAAMSHNVKVNALSSNAYLQTTKDGIKRDNADSNKSIYLKDIIKNKIVGTNDTTKTGISSYDTNEDTVTLTDGTVIANASKTAALSFKIKDAATTTVTTRYTTTTTDASGNVISGFVPPANGKTGTYTGSDGKKYDTLTTDQGDSIETDLFRTTDASGNVVSGFYPSANASSTYTDSDGKKYDAVTSTDATTGNIKTELTLQMDHNTKLTYTTSKQVYTTKTVDADSGETVPLYRPAENGNTFSAAAGYVIAQTPYTTTTTDGNSQAVKGFFPPSIGGTGTYTTGGITYDTSAKDDGAGNVVTTLVPQGGGANLTYTTKTVDSNGNLQKDFIPDTSNATVDSSSGAITTPLTTTTTTATNSDGSVSTSIVKTVPGSGQTVS